MKTKRTLKERYRTLQKITQIIYIIAVVGFLVLGGKMIYYEWAYREAIRLGAENTMTAIQMTAACMELGNFTQDEILRKTLDMFILNR